MFENFWKIRERNPNPPKCTDIHYVARGLGRAQLSLDHGAVRKEEAAENEEDKEEGRKEGGLREEPRDYLLPRRSFQTQGAFLKLAILSFLQFVKLRSYFQFHCQLILT